MGLEISGDSTTTKPEFKCWFVVCSCRSGVIAAMTPFQWHVDYDSAHTDATNYTKLTWRLRACEFPRRNSSAVLRAGERCSTCKGLKKGRKCFIFALFSTLGLMIILILETMALSPKERQFTGCLILWLIRFCHWKQKHQLNLLNTRNYLPSDFFIPSSLFGVLYVVCLRQETTAKIQERTGHLPGLQRLSGSDGNWCLIIGLSKISSKKSNPTSIHLIDTFLYWDRIRIKLSMLQNNWIVKPHWLQVKKGCVCEVAIGTPGTTDSFWRKFAVAGVRVAIMGCIVNGSITLFFSHHELVTF